MTAPQLPQLPYALPATQAEWQRFLNILQQWATILAPSGFTGTIATAKLTVGGANGSMTYSNGILTAQTPAT